MGDEQPAPDRRDFRSAEWREAWPHLWPGQADLAALRDRLYAAMDRAGVEFWTHRPCSAAPCRVCAVGWALHFVQEEADRRSRRDMLPVILEYEQRTLGRPGPRATEVERLKRGRSAASALRALVKAGDEESATLRALEHLAARYGVPARGAPDKRFEREVSALLREHGGYSLGEVAEILDGRRAPTNKDKIRKASKRR